MAERYMLLGWVVVAPDGKSVPGLPTYPTESAAWYAAAAYFFGHDVVGWWVRQKFAYIGETYTEPTFDPHPFLSWFRRKQDEFYELQKSIRRWRRMFRIT